MLDLARSSRWTRFWIILSIVGGLYMFYMSYFAFFTANTESIVHPTTVQHRCLWKEGDPVVYHLKTKMGVNYDAGHWFHMAENFMVQHSILRKAGELTNSSNIILNFDEGTSLFSLLVLRITLQLLMTLLNTITFYTSQTILSAS